MKPSPGPWTWQEPPESAGLGEYSYLHDAMGDEVITADGRTSQDDGVIIALAPEMRDRLLALEWSLIMSDSIRCCPECISPQLSGHVTPGCKFAALLEKLR